MKGGEKKMNVKLKNHGRGMLSLVLNLDNNERDKQTKGLLQKHKPVIEELVKLANGSQLRLEDSFEQRICLPGTPTNYGMKGKMLYDEKEVQAEIFIDTFRGFVEKGTIYVCLGTPKNHKVYEHIEKNYNTGEITNKMK